MAPEDDSPDDPDPSEISGEVSATTELQEETGQRFIKYIVGVFVAIGIGYGVGLILLDIIDEEFGALLGVTAMIIPLFGAPIIAMVTGLMTGLRQDASDKGAVLTSGVGAFLGFIALFVVILVFTSIVFDNGGSNGGDLGDFFLPLVGFGIGVAISGAGTTYVVREIEL